MGVNYMLSSFDPVYRKIVTNGGYKDRSGLLKALQSRNLNKYYKEEDLHNYYKETEIYKYDETAKERIESDFKQFSEELQMRTHKLTIQVLFLNYIFFNEDKKLSFYEKRLVRKYFKKDKKRISKSQYVSILKISKSVKTVDDIINYIKDFNLIDEEVNQSFKSVNKLCHDYRYHSVKELLSKKIDALFY